MKKQLLCLALCGLMLLHAFPICAGADGVTCSPVCEGTNQSANEYYWHCAVPIESYLAETADGMLMRVQWGALEGKMLVDYFEKDYTYRYSLVIDAELPIFGGFHAGTDGYYYLVTGQTNFDELADAECFRVTKYDRDWNRISAVGLYDCNTTVPFDAGSLRFAEHGKFLLIRTAHEMYTNDDGKNHQANVTLSLDTETMTFAGTACEVAFSLGGYVSHSFNQFIKTDGDTLLAVDHGDAYPRSIVLFRSTLPADGTLDVYGANGTYYGYPEGIDLFTFPGRIGDNYTGACVGGFEYSDSAYLVAFNTVAQDESYDDNLTKNIRIASVDRQTCAVRIIEVTDYAEGEQTTGVPHLVKLSDNSFLLMWMRGTELYYVMLDGNGETVGEVQCAPDGALSDCVPTVIDGKAVWYVYKGNAVRFYELDGKTLNVTNTDTGHDLQVLEYPTEAGGDCFGVCKRCGEEGYFATPESIELLWGYNPGESYLWGDYLEWLGPFEVGTVMYWSVTPGTGVTVEVSDPQGIVLDLADGTLLCAAEGTYTLTLSHAYNPHLFYEYDVRVGHRFRYGCSTVCENCGLEREAEHVYGEPYASEYPTCTEAGSGYCYCQYCYEEKQVAIPAMGHSYKNGICTECGDMTFVYGDVNDDGAVDGKDLVRLIRYLASYDPATGTADVTVGYGADVICDGFVNGADATRLIRYFAYFDPSTGTSSVELGTYW